MYKLRAADTGYDVIIVAAIAKPDSIFCNLARSLAGPARMRNFISDCFDDAATKTLLLRNCAIRDRKWTIEWTV